MTHYPFTALVGQDDLCLALLLNAVSPAVGGVLVRGEKGTAKSTAVRALAALLPHVDVVGDCRFSCDPGEPDARCPDGPHDGSQRAVRRAARLVELPLGASEDRLLGSLHLARVLGEGVTAFEPGLLAAAHRGVLYVDEVNLLQDHLVDALLDAAAMGVAHVERDAVSVRHASRFLLVGTMNPEEGELRPQLLDRFGLTVDVAASRDPGARADVVRRRLAFDADPVAFAATYADDEATLSARIGVARARLADVVLGDGALRQVTAVCAAFDVDGLRADLVTARAAIAHAAWQGRAHVTSEDVAVAARLALPHRRRRNPLDAPGLDSERLSKALAEAAAQHPDDDPDDVPDPDPGDGPGRDPDPGPDGPDAPQGGAAPDSTRDDQPQGEAEAGEAYGQTDAGGAGGSSRRDQTPAPAGATYRPRLFAVPGVGVGAAGRRSAAHTRTGRVTAASTTARGAGLHLVATVRAAAPQQGVRGRTSGRLILLPNDLRRAVRRGREGNLVLFCVDASGSMAARARMGAVKGAVLSLLLDAYQRRDKVGLVTFRGRAAELALPPTSSVEAAADRLGSLPTGGRTPLAAGLRRAAEVLRVERLRDPARRALLVVVTDGRASPGSDPIPVATALHRAGVASVVVDCESGPVRLGMAGALAAALGGEWVGLQGLAADSLAGVVRDNRRAA